MESGFENLNDALNTNYDVDEEIEGLESKAKSIEKIKESMADKDVSQELEDKEYKR